MSRQKRKNTVSRIIRADPEIFQNAQTLGFEYGTVFDRGYETLINEITTSRRAGQPSPGSLPLSQIDQIIEWTAERIQVLTKTREELIRIRDNRLMKEQPGRRGEDHQMIAELRNLIGTVYSDEEIREYHRVMGVRYDHGSTCITLIRGILKDLAARGGNGIVGSLRDRDPQWTETLIWNILTDRVRENPA